MKLSRSSIAMYIVLVFASGAVLGAFGQRFYTVSTVSAKAPAKNPEEFRQRIASEYRSRLRLNEQQVQRLEEIMDETRASFEATRKNNLPLYQKIHEEQTAKIKGMLTPDQQPEYEKILKEREEKRRPTPPHPPGPGF